MSVQRRDEEEGLTLVELLVVVLLMGVVGGIAVWGAVQSMHTTAYTQARGDALAATQMSLERMSREIRAGDPLRIAEPALVAVDVRRRDEAGGTYLDHVRYEILAAEDGWVIEEERWRFADASEFDAPGFVPTAADADEVSTRVLVRDLASGDGFSAVDADGEEVAASEARAVRIAVQREVDEDTPPIAIDTTVTIRNR